MEWVHHSNCGGRGEGECYERAAKRLGIRIKIGPPMARALVEEADRADAKVAAKKASEDRRQKWRDREVAAGRLKIFGAGEFFQRR